MDLADRRREYRHATLSRGQADADPIRQTRRWLDEATEAGLLEPTAMTLATADADGRPSARIVLLKGLDERGLTFFTNYESRKGRELAANPRAALLFYWGEIDRQLRVEGVVRRLSEEESTAYFASRPRGSRLGAWASPQSQVLAGRGELERRLDEVETRFDGEDEVPLPPFWGGYRLEPDLFELWQGRPSRLHDRLRYRREGDRWQIDRLAP